MNRDLSSARCGSCGAPVDPLFAPKVRVFESGVVYFCSVAHAESYEAEGRHEAPPETRLLSEGADQDAPLGVEGEATAGSFPAPVSSRGQPLAALPPVESRPHPATGPLSSEDRESETFWPVAARPGIEPAPPAFDWAREAARLSDPLELLPFFLLIVPLGVAAYLGEASVDLVLTVALSALFLILGRQLAAEVSGRATESLAPLRERMAAVGRTIRGGRRLWIAAQDLLPGEEVEVRAREIVPVDGVVVRGSAKLEPFTPDAPEIEVHQASAVVAGRCVLEGGPLHVAANRTGRERAFSLVLQEGKGSLIDDYSIVRVGRWLAVGIAPILALLSTIVSLYLASTWWRAVFVGAATWLAWSTPILHRALRERIWWVLGEAAARGIVFPRASVLETSSHVGTAVFCTRGTLLKGDPVVAEIHAFRDTSRERVISLAAGALRSVHHPAARATIVALESMSLPPETCRSHSAGTGASVRCLTRDGEELIVGGREFLLRHKISIAWIEEKLRGIEGEGQSALIVALGGHVIGVIALSDELSPGARATMQNLLMRGIEPALLSGGSRDTLEAIAKRLGIDHVRSESTERKEEVERLRTAGVPVAVIGQLGTDDRALSGADVPILFGGLNSFSSTFPPRDERRSVSVYGSHLPTCGQAILLAHDLRQSGIELLLVHSVTAAFATVAATLAVVPIATIPGLSLVSYLLSKRLMARAPKALSSLDS